MGKVSATGMKRRKKKGRPPKNSLSFPSSQKTVNHDFILTTNCRSNRVNPNHFNSVLTEFVVEGGDDDDERREKKVKLVGRLPESGESEKISQKKQHPKNKRHSQDDDSGSDSCPGSKDWKVCVKKRSINAVDHRSDGIAAIQEKKDVKATDSLPHGSPLESGPTTPLPERKLLDFILDRLQKKDMYGVFSEPVDINELPDYFEVIEQPMDFGTVRKKLDGGAYKILEQLEADVFLICSNAMQYNAPDTVYYRQARSIHEIAKRDFENLRHEGENGEPQPKVVRRGRPPSIKNQKKLLEVSSEECSVGPDLSSAGTILPRVEDGGTKSNSYNLRKAPAVNRFRMSDIFVPSYRSRSGENYSDLLADWNDEFPASVLRADMKYGKKQFTVDEKRREMYRKFHLQSSANNSSACCNSIGDKKQLIPNPQVGLHDPLVYAQSLARFAANLGPVAHLVAAKKMQTVFPGGPQSLGWVAAQPLSSTENQKPSNSSATTYMKTPFPVQPKPVYYQRNDAFHSNISASRYQGGVGEKLNLHGEGEEWSFRKSTRPPQLGYKNNSNSNIMLGPPDLNVGIPGSSSLQIGSPQQPDLALQL